MTATTIAPDVLQVEHRAKLFGMKTINRRTLNQQLAAILDAVLDTGEPIRVEGRDGRAVVIERAKEETTYERWVRTGAIRPAKSRSPEDWASLGKITGVDADWLIKEMEEEW